jgi:hypothetical protein
MSLYLSPVIDYDYGHMPHNSVSPLLAARLVPGCWTLHLKVVCNDDDDDDDDDDNNNNNNNNNKKNKTTTTIEQMEEVLGVFVVGRLHGFLQ